jgi:hypothetical protein
LKSLEALTKRKHILAPRHFFNLTFPQRANIISIEGKAALMKMLELRQGEEWQTKRQVDKMPWRHFFSSNSDLRVCINPGKIWWVYTKLHTITQGTLIEAEVSVQLTS